jgi:hypothetical protein
VGRESSFDQKDEMRYVVGAGGIAALFGGSAFWGYHQHQRCEAARAAHNQWLEDAKPEEVKGAPGG